MASSISLNQVVKHLNLPLLLSIGIHGLFFTIILPDWNNNNNLSSSDSIQNTPVIELNELEKTRLPQPKKPLPTFDWNIVNTLPSQNNNPITLNIPNLPPPPQTNQLPLPQINNGGIVNIPNFPPPPPVNVSPDNPTPTQNNLPNLEPQIYTSNYPSQLPPPPNFNGGDINQPTILDSVPTIDNSDLPTYNSQPKPRISLSPEEEAKMRAKIFGNSQIQITANPRDVINGRNNSDDNNINSNDRATVIKPLPQNYESLASKLEKKSANTTDEEARKNYVTWATKVKDAKSKQITLRGIYPKDACIRKLEGTTTYGVTVNASGNVVKSQLIKSSGYGLFNDRALRQIKGHKFANNTGGNQPYHVYVNFDYNQKVCPSLSIDNIGDLPPQKSPNQTTPKTNTNPSPTQTKPQPTTIPIQPKNTPKPTQTQTKPQTITIPTKESENTPETSPTQTKPQTTTIPVKPPEKEKLPEQSQVKPQPTQTNPPVELKTTPKNTPTPVKPKSVPETKLPNTPENKADSLILPQPTNPSKTETNPVKPNIPETQNKPIP